MELHIIYTEAEMLLSKECLDKHAGFKTSLGPWEQDAVIEYLTDEYDLKPSAAIQVNAFVVSEAPTCLLTFS
ncbi:hypothetical protein GTP56_11725 [Duganella sp. FT134W]|uniref:Uncharacterized protein n=1 Tax=Duganella margarita TaxID=2692170 RepID=A0A7X4H025_9BURK|nr:hypothetical protein [Duganella margarita]MYM72867.1 hypothetical protein [Duganella margarita]